MTKRQWDLFWKTHQYLLNLADSIEAGNIDKKQTSSGIRIFAEDLEKVWKPHKRGTP